MAINQVDIKNKAPYLAIGLMSGTSMDGVDAALINTDGKEFLDNKFKFFLLPYKDSFKKLLRNAVENKDFTVDLEVEFTRLNYQAILGLLKLNDINIKEIEVIGFHGHTIFHDSKNQISNQMGDAKLLAELTGRKIVYNFRQNDIKHGGQGAPLVPIYHKLLVKNQNIKNPVLIINIGGVANITYIDDKNLIAFDTGPGNAIIDDLVFKETGEYYDKNGAIANSGNINHEILSQLLDHEYFSKKAPKSLDRNDFSITELEASLQELNFTDKIATLSAFTCASIIKSLDLLPKLPTSLLVAGGGRHNQFIMKNLDLLLKGKYSSSVKYRLSNIDDLGYKGDAIEAEAFALMAVRRLKNLPISFPTTTGCSEELAGGDIIA